MSVLNKRPIAFSADRGVASWFDHVSKAFLADVMVRSEEAWDVPEVTGG